MAMRELVSGGAACAVPGSSSSNPVGALSNALMVSSSKTQERLQEIPNTTNTGLDGNLYGGMQDSFAALPGSELEHKLYPNTQGSEFLRSFQSADENRFADAWDEIQRPPVHHYQGTKLIECSDGPPQRVLSNFLHSFLHSNNGGIPVRLPSHPTLGLSQGDKQRIRDRSSIMARHLFSDKSDDFIHAQVNTLLASLDINSDIQAQGPMPGRVSELEISHGPHGWAKDFSAEQEQRVLAEDEGVREFSKLNVNDLAEEFQVTNAMSGEASADDWANTYDDYEMAEHHDVPYSPPRRIVITRANPTLIYDPWTDTMSGDASADDWLEEYAETADHDDDNYSPPRCIVISHGNPPLIYDPPPGSRSYPNHVVHALLRDRDFYYNQLNPNERELASLREENERLSAQVRKLEQELHKLKRERDKYHDSCKRMHTAFKRFREEEEEAAWLEAMGPTPAPPSPPSGLPSPRYRYP